MVRGTVTHLPLLRQQAAYLVPTNSQHKVVADEPLGRLLASNPACGIGIATTMVMMRDWLIAKPMCFPRHVRPILASQGRKMIDRCAP